MTDNEYLDAVLREQTLTPGGAELADLVDQQENVERLLKNEFGKASMTIQRGGSRAKGTMIKEAYDLDLPIYFDAEENAAGETLEEIFNNVADEMSKEYYVERRRSALRLREKDEERDTHIDMVPGRFFDAAKTDAWIYQNNTDKCRLKTNLQVHIEHIRDSGVVPAIRLAKLWNVRRSVGMKTFVLELAIVELLKDRKSSGRATQLKHVLEQFRDEADSLVVVDPANGNNDLTPALAAVKSALKSAAESTLQEIEQDGWEKVFGPTTEVDRASAAVLVANSVPATRQFRPHGK